jgi:hypothetical protein
MEGSNAWWPMEGEGEASFHLFPLSPQQILLKPSFFSLILRFYFTMVLGRYLHISFLFLDLYITTMHFDVTSPSHIHGRFDFDFDFFSFLSLKLWHHIWPLLMSLKLHK